MKSSYNILYWYVNRMFIAHINEMWRNPLRRLRTSGGITQFLASASHRLELRKAAGALGTISIT